jgi:hypothetical protein
MNLQEQIRKVLKEETNQGKYTNALKDLTEVYKNEDCVCDIKISYKPDEDTYLINVKVGNKDLDNKFNGTDFRIRNYINQLRRKIKEEVYDYFPISFLVTFSDTPKCSDYRNLKESKIPIQVLRRHDLIDEMFKDMRIRYKRLFCEYRNPNILLGVLYERTLSDLYYAWFSETVSDDDWEVAAEYIEKYIIDKYEKETINIWDKRCKNKSSLSEEESELISLVKRVINEGLHDTSWENDEGDKVTLMDLLNATEDIPVKRFSVEELKPHLLSWDGDEEEIIKIDSADLQYPILIFVDNDGEFISIIDGHHRAQKAVRKGLKTIKAKIIPINDLPKDIRKVFSHMGRQEEMKESELTEKCWKGYTQKGMKTMFGKRYPNCVKKTK